MARLQVMNWDKCFENNRTRKVDKQDHCIVPNKQLGAGYIMLLDMDGGEALYGAFHAIILYLSKQPHRDGWLTEDGTSEGRPLTARILAKRTNFSENTIQRMLDVVTNDIGWINDHSSKEKKGGAAYPDKRVDIRFIVLAKEFHKIQIINHPNQIELQKESVSGTTLVGAQHLEMFHLKHDWSIETIKALLEWIPDNPFWCYQIRSLASIRKRSRRNDDLKFANALAQMKSEAEMDLLDGEHLEQDMFNRNLGTEDYDEVPHPRTGEILWRRKT